MFAYLIGLSIQILNRDIFEIVCSHRVVNYVQSFASRCFMDLPAELIDNIDSVSHAMSLAGMIRGQMGDDEFPGALSNSFLEYVGLAFDSHYKMLLVHSAKDFRDNLNGCSVLDNLGISWLANLGERSLALFTDRYCRLRGGFQSLGTGPAPDVSLDASQLRADLQAVVAAAQAAIAAAGAVQGLSTSGTATPGAAATGSKKAGTIISGLVSPDFVGGVLGLRCLAALWLKLKVVSIFVFGMFLVHLLSVGTLDSANLVVLPILR